MVNGLKKFISEIHSVSVNNGFWSEIEIIEKLKNSNCLTSSEIESVKDAFLCQKIMLAVTELSESVQSLRCNKRSNLLNMYPGYKEMHMDESENFYEMNIKDSFEDELADAVIRIFNIAASQDIDLVEYINIKHNYNSSRPKLHNKKF